MACGCCGEHGRRKMGCGAGFTKCLLIVLIIVLLVFGTALFGISIYIISHPELNDYLKVVEHEQNNDFLTGALIIMIMVGFFIAVTAIFGLIGCAKNSRCLIYVFLVLMLGVILVEVAATVLSIYFKATLTHEVKDSMQLQVHEKVTLEPDDHVLTKGWFQMQMMMKCCGGYGYGDYSTSLFLNTSIINGSPRYVPKTCCKLKNKDAMNAVPVDYQTCQREARNKISDPQQLYSEGCFESIKHWLTSHAAAVTGIAAAILVGELVIVWFSCILVCELNRMKRATRK